MWNIDKTNFWIGCRKAQLVVTIDANKFFCMINPENHNYIISIKYINLAGKTIPPMLLISRVNILYK